MSGTGVTPRHLDLLTNFGKNSTQQRANEQQKEELWRLSCQSAGLPYIRLPLVVEQWKDFVVGNNKSSGIALSATMDPGYLTVGITFRKTLRAAHTCRTKALLFRILRVYAHLFDTPQAFLNDVQKLCNAIINNKKPGPTGSKSSS